MYWNIVKRVALVDEMYDGKDEELKNLNYEAYSVKKLRDEGVKLSSDYSIIKFAQQEDMVLITEDNENKIGCDENKILCIKFGQNPSVTEIDSKLKELEKTFSKKQKTVMRISVVATASLFLWFWLSFHAAETFFNLPYSNEEFITATASSGLGLLFMFLRRFPSLDDKLLKSMEILMFFITPTALSFPLFPENGRFAYILVAYFSVIMTWFGTSLSLVSRGPYSVSKGMRSRYTRFWIIYLWVFLMGIGCLIVYTFLAFTPKLS